MKSNYNITLQKYIVLSVQISNRQRESYNLKYYRQCNNISHMNLSGYLGHVTIFS